MADTMEQVAGEKAEQVAGMAADVTRSIGDAGKHNADVTAAAMGAQKDRAMAEGKAALEQVAERTQSVIEKTLKGYEELSSFGYGNFEALAAMSRAAAKGFEAIAQQASDFSRRSFEEAEAAFRGMTSVSSPNELVQLQNEFAKAQFDSVVSEFSKLSETMIKVIGDVVQPLSSRTAVATDRLKTSLRL